jgi:hypothetical protein
MLDTRPSRREQLSQLRTENADELMALRRLGAWHSESSAPELSFRDHGVRAGDRIFPAPDTVPGLTAIAIAALRNAFAECKDHSDEILVATFGAYVVTAIHPFADKNGHVALDFFQYLLQRRPGLEELQLNDKKDTHELIGLAFAPMDVGPAGNSADDHLARVMALMERLDAVTLAGLWKDPNLVAAAHFLSLGCAMEFESKLAPRA